MKEASSLRSSCSSPHSHALPHSCSSHRSLWLSASGRTSFVGSSSVAPSVSCSFKLRKKNRLRASMDQQLDITSADPSRSQASVARIQHLLNVSSRWVVVAMVIAVVVWRRCDDQVLWAITGGIINAGNSKLLKKCFNQPRPLTALGMKADPGMPSSHAQSLGYFSLYAALGLLFWLGINLASVAFAAAILMCGSYLAWLRISQGLHTLAQVGVGAGFGCCTAIVWISLWHYSVKQVVASSVVYHYWVLCLFGFSVACFVAFGIRKWHFGEA